jgi:zona occludens toxin
MLTMFTGTPGAGKTAALVDILADLIGDRPIFVAGSMEGGKLVPSLEGLTIPHTVIKGEDWPTELPDGAIMVLDEAQQLWRPRGPGAKVPPHVSELETHRHRGLDILLTTQSPKLIDANVRALVGRHVHIRDVGWYGRWWYEWPECNDALAWKSCQNKKRYKLPKRVFELYKSASLHVKPLRGFPPALIGLMLLLVFLAGLVWFITGRLNSKTAAPELDKKGQVVTGLPPMAQPRHIASASASPPPAAGGAAVPDERVDFIPRVYNRPWTAPAYDALRKVSALPTITGAICINDKCECYHHKAKLLDVASEACASWAKDRPFNPYLADEASGTPGANTTTPVPETRAAPSQSATGTVAVGGAAQTLGVGVASAL